MITNVPNADPEQVGWIRQPRAGVEWRNATSRSSRVCQGWWNIKANDQSRACLRQLVSLFVCLLYWYVTELLIKARLYCICNLKA